tara:strand:- start:69 stop:1361 length:1293 start_codon:yes stop_codon:yes gene_type:complete
MARKQTLDLILQTFRQLGGNLNEVMGTKTNINFLGKGKSPEFMLDMDINTEALGVLPQSAAVDELKNSVGYALSGKLNDIQANKLLSNMTKMKDFYMPPAGPANITDLRTGTAGLDKGGLESLRESEKIRRFYAGEKTGKPVMTKIMQDDIRALQDDLPPPGSRGGPEDIAAPFSGSGLEALKNVKNNNLIMNDVLNKIYLNAGVSENAQPVVRANAREFLNRIKDLSDDVEGPTLSGVMEADDFKFMTEGGGGAMGDPFLLVQKYFGPKVASAVAKLDTPDDIQLFAERLISVKDAKGRGVTDRFFDPESVDFSDFEFAEGGRVPFFRGRLVGKALGMAMRRKALERGAGEGFAAAEAYGITGKDVSRLFAELATDKTLVGKEKTAYIKLLNQALKNPEDFPEEILQIQKKLGIDIGMKSGGLAKILEV